MSEISGSQIKFNEDFYKHLEYFVTDLMQTTKEKEVNFVTIEQLLELRNEIKSAKPTSDFEVDYYKNVTYFIEQSVRIMHNNGYTVAYMEQLLNLKNAFEKQLELREALKL